MGFGAVAGHLVMFLAVFGAGVLMAGAINNSMSAQIEARNELGDRLRLESTADYELVSEGFVPERCVDDQPQAGCQGTIDPESTYANFTNEGSREVNLTDVTLLVDGTQTDHDQVETFEIRDNASSDIWLPGEILEIEVENQGDVDITIAGPHGVTAHRRN